MAVDQEPVKSSLNEEQAYWRRLVDEVHVHMSYPKIAAAINISDRQIFNIRNGHRPTGLTAIRLYTLHLQYNPMQNNSGIELHCLPKPIA